MPYVIGKVKTGMWTWVFADRHPDRRSLGALLAVCNLRLMEHANCRSYVECMPDYLREYEMIVEGTDDGRYIWYLQDGGSLIKSASTFATIKEAEQAGFSVWPRLYTPLIQLNSRHVPEELWLIPGWESWDWEE